MIRTSGDFRRFQEISGDLWPPRHAGGVSGERSPEGSERSDESSVSLLAMAPGVSSQELIMKHSAFVGFPIDLRMEHRQAELAELTMSSAKGWKDMERYGKIWKALDVTFDPFMTPKTDKEANRGVPHG